MNWVWENGNATITDGMDAIAVYVGTDSENYKTTAITIHIAVLEDAEPDPEDKDDGKEEPNKGDQNNETNDSSANDSPINAGVAVVAGVGATGVGIGSIALVVLARRRKRL